MPAAGAAPGCCLAPDALRLTPPASASRLTAYASCLAAAIAAAACTVGPNFTKPQIDSPQAWRVEYEAAAEVANTRWWEAFGDPALDQLIDAAVRENLDVQIAAARVDQFLGALRTTRSQFYPQFDYAAEASRNRASTVSVPAIPPGTDRDYSLYQAALGASWQIDLFGRVRRQTEAAQAQVYSSEQGRRGVILSVVTSVATGYIVLRGLDRQLEIARATADNYAETVKLFELRFKGGVVSEVELAQVQSQYQQALAAIPSLERQIAEQENLLSILLGRNPELIPRGMTIEQLAEPGIPGALPASLLERRPDILQAEQRLRASNAQIGVAKSLYYPTLSLTGVLGLASTCARRFRVQQRDHRVPCRRADGSDLHLRQHRGPGELGGSGAAREPRVLPAGRAQRLPRDQRRADRRAEDARGVHRARQAGRCAAPVRRPVAAALRQRRRRLYRSAVRGERAVRRRAQRGATCWRSATARWSTCTRRWAAAGWTWPIRWRAQPAASPAPAPEAAPAAASATATGAAAAAASPADNQDRTAVVQEGKTSVLNVYRERGIGGVEVRAPKSGWPAALMVRFHGFPGLESFTAKTPTASLLCQTQRPEGRPPEDVCTLNGARVETIRKSGDLYEVGLPASMLTPDTAAIEVRWVDQWR